MNVVILQPAGSVEASQHYKDTVENRVPLEHLTDFVEQAAIDELARYLKHRLVSVWGVTPGKNGGNIGKWKKINPGDVALFSRGGGIFSSATVVKKIHNKKLAESLWGIDVNTGQTWEYVYFLDEVHAQQIPYGHFNKVVGYKDNYVIQGFNVLDEEKSERFIQYFDLASETYYPDVTEEQYLNAGSADFFASLDKKVLANARTEQAFLRKKLFGGKFEKCGICEKKLPISFLVAAHIKRRADCTDAERRDYQHVVMPMCRLGCDELYEKGYIAVVDGTIISLHREDTTESLDALISSVVGKRCALWSQNTEKYFRWHAAMCGERARPAGPR